MVIIFKAAIRCADLSIDSIIVAFPAMSKTTVVLIAHTSGKNEITEVDEYIGTIIQ
jgi:hypothetical protein